MNFVKYYEKLIKTWSKVARGEGLSFSTLRLDNEEMHFVVYLDSRESFHIEAVNGDDCYNVLWYYASGKSIGNSGTDGVDYFDIADRIA